MAHQSLLTTAAENIHTNFRFSTFSFWFRSPYGTDILARRV